MATYNSKNTQNIKDGYRPAAGEIISHSYFAYDEYVAASALVAADVLVSAIKVPAGAKVLNVKTVVPTNGGTMSVGTVGTPTKYVSAAAAGTAIVQLATDTTSEDSLIFTIGGTPSAAGTYKVIVEYIKY